MQAAVYFANCLYKSGQTSGIQDTDRHGHRAKQRADSDIVAEEFFSCAFIDKHRHLRLAHGQTRAVLDFLIGNRETPYQQAVVRILPLMTS